MRSPQAHKGGQFKIHGHHQKHPFTASRGLYIQSSVHRLPCSCSFHPYNNRGSFQNTDLLKPGGGRKRNYTSAPGTLLHTVASLTPFLWHPPRSRHKQGLKKETKRNDTTGVAATASTPQSISSHGNMELPSPLSGTQHKIVPLHWTFLSLH